MYAKPESLTTLLRGPWRTDRRLAGRVDKRNYYGLVVDRLRSPTSAACKTPVLNKGLMNRCIFDWQSNALIRCIGWFVMLETH